MSDKTNGGFFEQCVGKINPVLVEHYYGNRISDTKESFPVLLQVMESHVLMLGKTGIIPAAAGRDILASMEELFTDIPEPDHSLEDLYINFEAIMKARVGSEIAGYIPAGRSRNDVEAAMNRITLRKKMFALADTLMDILHVLHDRAKETAGYVFPGYTYRQQAQPTTMGHYLLGIGEALTRDVERILQCVARFDYNPFGSAAFAGTRFPLDQALTARYMGFTGIAGNTNDAVSAADFLLESANCALLAMQTLGRLSQDIVEWCANEVNFAELPIDMIDSSSIMPQKRNPVICETVRAYARSMAGQYAGMCAASTVEFEATRDVTVVCEQTMNFLATADHMAHICQAYTAGLIFHPEVMLKTLDEGFSNATELADTLVIDGGLTFREAHSIVGGAIAQLCREGRGQKDLTYELMNQYCEGQLHKPLPLSREAVNEAKDFACGTERRCVVGGTSQAEIGRMLRRQQEKSAALEARMREKRALWDNAEVLLHKDAAEWINNH